jgi:hypothetical protein
MTHLWSAYPLNRNKLPVLELCNKYKPNPNRGHGPLGNQYSKPPQMSYDNEKGDVEELVKLLQTMLDVLGYLQGEKGVDGKFGDDTEDAIKRFQNEHKDFEGKPLLEDGLVGPRTADALNRAVVGKPYWSDEYATPKELTDAFLLVTVRDDALKKGISIDPKGVKKAKIVLKEPDGYLLPLKIRLFDPFGKPIPNVPYRLSINQETLEGKADENGWLETQVLVEEIIHESFVEWGDTGKPGAYKYALWVYLDFEDMNEEEAVQRRLHNLGYPFDRPLAENILNFQREYHLAETGKLEDVKDIILKWHDEKFKENKQLFADFNVAPSETQGDA